MRQLLHGKFRVLQCNRAEAGKSFRIYGASRGNVFVLHAHDFARQIRFRPIIILVWRRAEHLHIYAHRIHIAQPFFQTRHFTKGLRQQLLHVMRDRSRALRAEHQFRLALFLRTVGDERLDRRREQMRMQIYREVFVRPHRLHVLVRRTSQTASVEAHRGSLPNSL